MRAKLRNMDFVLKAGSHWSLLPVVKPAGQAWRVVVEEAGKTICPLKGQVGVFALTAAGGDLR